MNASELRAKLTLFWSPALIHEGHFHVDIGSTEWHPDNILGYCFSESSSQELWQSYLKNRGVKSILPASVLIIRPHQDDGLGDYRQTAIHEFAHLIRDSFNILYPRPKTSESDISQLVQDMLTPHFFNKRKVSQRFITNFSQVIENFYMNLWHEQEQELRDFESAIFPEEERKIDPIFGEFALSWCQFDFGHDPLFYLIFHLLDRKAKESGFYKIKGKPQISRTF